ncbi:hypothetical protein A9Y58_00218 [Streptococcus parauberis]|nr:hypothetical protein ASN87_00960 [Streptococcus parauberis]PCH14293.1 hypothetical protein A9Y58_00218 [Streptococcus parauberis]
MKDLDNYEKYFYIFYSIFRLSNYYFNKLSSFLISVGSINVIFL